MWMALGKSKQGHDIAKTVIMLLAISGIATVEHRWARAHPTSTRVGREICTNTKIFFGGVGWGGSRLCMSLNVHRISSMNTTRKCVCPLQIVYAYLACAGGFAPDPHRGSAPGPRWVLPSPRPLCPLPTLPPNPGYATASNPAFFSTR